MKVLASGTFNLVHPGHLFFLRRAKALGDKLIVVVASDRTVLDKKDYLLAPAHKRAEGVLATGIPDRVVVGDEKDWMKVVRDEKPDIIALGFDQEIKEGWLERELGKAGLPVKVKRINESLPGYSTKKIVKEK